MTTRTRSGDRFLLAILKSLSAGKNGFTLIELLIVIAIIGILASLLLPALHNAKAAAKSAICQSNLHQQGAILVMYLNDYRFYPGNACWYDAQGNLKSVDGLAIHILRAYAPRLSSNGRSAFHCPARGRERDPIGAGVIGFERGYGFNAVGTAWTKNPKRPLGLQSIHYQPIDESGSYLHAITTPQVSPDSIQAPGDMVAISDSSKQWDSSVISPDAEARFNLALGPIHNQGANVLFADGHVEYGKQNQWIKPSATARQRWNNDHEPHAEMWSENYR